MTLSQSIIATLAYHNIFDFPLTLAEVHQYLISNRASLTAVKKEVERLSKAAKIGYSEGLYFLAGRRQLASLRKRRQRYSQAKLKKASFFAKILKVIPSLKLVAISGALAMQNSHQDDDIDLVIITSKDLLWTTRFLANIFLLPFRRDPQGRSVSDRACLNLFLAESSLKIKEQNFYIAHEICQMRPLWDRDGTYQRFLNANKWVKKYLPNWQESSRFTVHGSQKRRLSTVENLLKSFQLWYMRGKITTEKIGEGQLFFHPSGTQEWVIREYRKHLARLKISLP